MFNSDKFSKWPTIRKELLVEDEINLPVQIHGKFVTTIKTKKDYDEGDILNSVYHHQQDTDT